MPIVLYTNEKLEVGSVVDTRKFCGLNAEALRGGTREEQEVEGFLEEVREEHFPEAPDRLCSVVGIPIPRMTGRVREGDVASGKWFAFTEIETPEPPGWGEYCYHIVGERGSKRVSVDEGWVGKLVEDWNGLRGSFERWKLASDYWAGKIFREYSVLIQGPIRVVSECGRAHGGRRLKPMIWEAD